MSSGETVLRGEQITQVLSIRETHREEEVALPDAGLLRARVPDAGDSTTVLQLFLLEGGAPGTALDCGRSPTSTTMTSRTR